MASEAVLPPGPQSGGVFKAVISITIGSAFRLHASTPLPFPNGLSLSA